MTELGDLLTQTREADPSERINLRDPVAAHGELAVEAMTDWLGDPRLAAFAIRVLERIGREPTKRAAVSALLAATDRSELPAHLVTDLDWALVALGGPPTRSRSERPSNGVKGTRAAGRPGVAGRGYWVMRTSPWERPYLWAEAQAGRLRQGWGVEDEQNLEVIAATLRRGEALSGLQRESRGALRMLATWDSGVRFGDVIVVPNLPDYGRLSVFRVSGSYEWAPGPPLQHRERFGHILPVELLLSNVDRHGPDVSQALVSALRPQARLYNISGYGGDVERLLGNEVPTKRRGELWTEAEYEILFGRFPPSGPRPSDVEVDALAAEFGRTHDAVRWQWEDGASYGSGGSASTTSDPLKAWLDRREIGR